MEKPSKTKKKEDKDSDDSSSDQDEEINNKNKKNKEHSSDEEEGVNDDGGDENDSDQAESDEEEEKKENPEKKEVENFDDDKKQGSNQQQESQEPQKKQNIEQEQTEQQIQEQKEEIKEEPQKPIKSINKSNTVQPKFSQQIFNFLRKKSDVESAKKRFSSQNVQNAAENSNSNVAEIWEYQRQISIEKHQQLCDHIYNKLINRSDVITDIFQVSIQLFNSYHQQLLKFINMQLPKTQQQIQKLQNQEQQQLQQQNTLQQILSDFSKIHDKNYVQFHQLLNYIQTQILQQNLEPNLKNYKDNIKNIVKQYQTQQKAIQTLNEEISKKSFVNFKKVLQTPLQSADKSATKKKVKDLYYLQQKYLCKVSEHHTKQKALGISVLQFWEFQKELEVSLLDYVKKAFSGYVLQYQQVFSHDQEGMQQISTIFQNFDVEKNLKEKHSLVLFQDVIVMPESDKDDEKKFDEALKQYFQNFSLKVLQETQDTQFFKELFEVDAEYKSGKNNVQNKYILIITNSYNIVVGEKIEKVLFTNHIVNPLYQINIFTQKINYLPKDNILEIFDIKTKLFSSIKKLSIKFQNEQEFQRFQNSINQEK